ncbi:MAG: hypothetical protein IJ880_14830 [Bacilli bacterium]|nr:hypothetical protein [Bacilli bacterium]
MEDSNIALNAISDIKGDIVTLINNDKNDNALESMEKHLNDLFPDATCKRVEITNNTDKQFFGIIVMPIINAQQVMDIALSDKNYQVKDYKVEFDSKMFNGFFTLTADEIEAILIHEVGMLVSDDTPAKRVRYMIDKYVMNTGENMKVSDYVSYVELLGFGIKDAMHKSSSMFYTDFKPSTIDDAYTLTEFIVSGMNKIKNNQGVWEESLNYKITTTLRWVLRLYRDILKYRIMAIHCLKKGIEITGSSFMKIEMQNVINRLNKIDDLSLIRESVSSFIDNKKKAISNAFDSFKRNGIKAYADDLYDIRFQAYNMDDDRGTAMMLLHKINSRMSVIEDYIMTEENLSPQDVKKLQDLYNKYDELRSEISSKKLRSPRTLYIGYDD